MLLCNCQTRVDEEYRLRRGSESAVVFGFGDGVILAFVHVHARLSALLYVLDGAAFIVSGDAVPCSGASAHSVRVHTWLRKCGYM